MIFGKYINIYYKKYWAYFVFGFLALIVVDIVQLYIPQLVAEMIEKLTNLYNINNPSNVVDLVTDPNKIWGYGTNLFNLNDYYYYFGTFSLIVVVIGLCRFIWRYCLNIVQVKIEADLRHKMFYHVENLSTSFFNMQKTGGLMAYFTNDIESVCCVFSDGLIYSVDVLVLGIVAFTKMCLVNWFLAIICALPMIFFACIGYYIEKIQSLKFEKRQERFERLSDMVQENLSGITVVKAFCKEISEAKKFANLNKSNKMVNQDFLKYSVKVDVLINALAYSAFFLLVLFGGLMIIRPEFFSMIPLAGHLDVKGMVEFFGYYDSLIWPMIAIGMLVNIISQSKASLKRITYLLDQKNEVREPKISSDKEFVGKIEFRNLSFNYPDSDNKVLKNINITIDKGMNVGIIGKTGCGKSTLVNTLLKLYNIEENMVLIDNIDINDWNSKVLREHIGYVAQETFLFSDYIDANIAFADENISEELIKKAAKFACVDDNIQEFKNGYKTIIGERGATLSGGQKQRISMARAIIKNPEILILDDSVSAVDSNTEKEILTNIKKDRKNKTTLIIAHRISAVEDLDMIIVMDNGYVVDFGTHEYLKQHCKLYKSLCELQSLEKEV